MTESFDVAVLGGGPAGLAAAALLSERGASVVLLERGKLGGPRVGETFGPEVKALLDKLGVGEEFLALDFYPFRGVRSAWGSAEPLTRDSIVHPLGDGFFTDRAAFDALLARHATRRGATLHEQVGVVSVAPPNGRERWHFTASDGRSFDSAFFIDASGRGAAGGAKGLSGRHWLAFDRTVALVARMSLPSGKTLEPELLIESAEEGWWYAVPQPGDCLLVVMLTDADLVASGPREELGARFSTALEKTLHTRLLAEGAAHLAPVRVVRADTGRLLPDRGSRWWAIGDAAFAADPLSGDGVVRALRSALDVVARIAETDPTSEEGAAPQNDVGKAFLQYLDLRGRYYRVEPRFADSPFWARRHGFDWETVPIGLDPRKLLSWDGVLPDPRVIAPLEGLLPPRAIAAALERMKTPSPAHEVLAAVRDFAPIGDRRLVVGLEMLVAGGFVREM